MAVICRGVPAIVVVPELGVAVIVGMIGHEVIGVLVVGLSLAPIERGEVQVDFAGSLPEAVAFAAVS